MLVYEMFACFSSGESETRGLLRGVLQPRRRACFQTGPYVQDEQKHRCGRSRNQ